MERPFESRERICRLCLGTLGYFVNIFDNHLEMDNLATKIMRCAAIEVKKSDGLPDSACHRCVAKVESSYEFRLLCESSDAKLRRLLLPKILDEEKYDDMEREQKQVLNCEISEQTLNETSSEEITILYVSTKRTKNTTKPPEAAGSASQYNRRESICSISKSRCSPEPPLNHQPVQESVGEDVSVPQPYSGFNRMVRLGINHSDQCTKNVTEGCDQQYFNADHSSVRNDNLQVQCIQEKRSNECHSFSSSLESVPETNPVELHERQIRTHVVVNEYSIQSKETLPDLSTVSLELLPEHAKADSIVNTSVRLTSDNPQVQCIQEKRSNECHSFSSSLESVLETNPIELHDRQIRTHVAVNEYSIQSKETLPNLSTVSLELLPEHAKADSIVNTSVMLASETDSSLLLKCANSDIHTGEDPQKKKGETINSLSPRERLSYFDMTTATNDCGTMDSGSMLPSCASYSVQEEAVLHSHFRDIAEVDCSSEPPLERGDSVNNEGSPQSQSNTKIPLKLYRQSRHASTKNAAEALIMLSNSVKNSTSLPDNNIEPSTLSTGNLTNRCAENVECATENNTNELLDTYLTTTLSLIHVEENLLHSVENDLKSNLGDESSEKTLSKKGINVKIKRVSGKYSVEKVSDYQLNASTCITANHMDTTSGDVHAGTASQETKGTNSKKKYNSCRRNRVSAKLNHVLVSSTVHCKTNEALSRNDIPSVEKVNNTDLNRYSKSLTESVTKSQSSDSQDLNKDADFCEYTIDNSRTTDCNLAVEEMPIQQKISADFSKIPSENEVTSKEFHASEFWLVNEGTSRSKLREQRENIGNISESAESELCLMNADYDVTPINEKRSCKRSYGNRGYSNRKKKSRTKHKFKHCDSRVTLIDNQHQIENISEVACHEISNRKLSARANIKAVKHLLNNGETFSTPKHNAISFGGRRTKTVHCDEVCSPEEPKSLLKQSESDISKDESQSCDIYGLSVHSATNQYQRGHTFTSTSPVNSNTSKSNCKKELPLKELRVLLLRLEIDANGHYLNGGKRVNISSINSSELRLKQTSISNNSQQNALSNPCSLEDSSKKQILHLSLCEQKSNFLEESGATSAKVSHRRHKRPRHKKTIRAAKKQDKTSKILTSSSVPNSSVPNSSSLKLSSIKSHKNQMSKYSQKITSRLTKEGEDSNRSINDRNKGKIGCKSPRITSESTPNGSVETPKARRTVGRWNSTAKVNTIAVSTSKVIHPVDNMKKTEASNQHCCKLTKEKLVTSNLSLDSAKTTVNSQLRCGASYNLNGKMNQSGNYKTASSKINANPTNIYPLRKTVLSSTCKGESVTSNDNKQSHKEISGADFKICEQANNLTNNHEPFTPSGLNNSKIVDVARNQDCTRDNMEVSRCDIASSIREMNNDIENIKSRPICKEKCRTPRTLTIENYRKLRQSELHRCSKPNTSNNNKHDMNIVQAYAACFGTGASHSESANTMFRHAGKTVNISPLLKSFYTDQGEFGIKNSINSLNNSANSRHTNSELWQPNAAKESWRVPRNFLGNLCITKEAISRDEKYKACHIWNSGFQKDKRNKCQQILQSANHIPPGYKQVFEKCKNMINDMKTANYHEGDDDEQCTIIRKEILKSAYMTPQLAVLTADSPRQPSTFWFEERHPETESVSPATIVCCSPSSSDLRDCECIENVAPSDLHEDGYQVKNPQKKNENAQNNNKSSLQMEIGIPHLYLKESDDSSKVVTLTNKPVTNEKADLKTHEVKSNNNITLNGQTAREISKTSSRRNVGSSSSLEEQLHNRKHDTVLRNRSKRISCKTGAVSLSPRKRANETKSVKPIVQQKHEKDSCFVENLSTAFPRNVHCYVNAAKPTGNEDINAESKIANSTAMCDSRMETHLSGIQDEPNTLNFRSSSKEKHDASFRSGATSQSILRNETSLDNSAEHKLRKGLKRKNESNEQKVLRTSEQDKSSSIETTGQVDSLIEKGTCVSKCLEHGYSDDPLEEHISCKYTTQDVQERNVHQSTETSTLQQSTNISNPTSLSFTEGKMQEAFSNTFDAVISEGEPTCSARKNTTEQKHNSAASDRNFELSTVEDTDFVPDYEFSDSNSRSCSEDNNQTELMFPTSIPNSITQIDPSFGTQLGQGPNISSNEDKNNENQAPKRVCYTSNFIRKDLCDENVLAKTESKRLVQSKTPFPLGKATRIDRRSNSLESRSNNKPDGKCWMNLLCRKSEVMCTKTRDSSALKEISHQQGENNKTVLCEQKRTAESVSTSVSSTAESRFPDQNVSKNNTNIKDTSEIHPDIGHSENVDTLNLFDCEKNSSLNELREEIKTRVAESTRKVNESFFSNSNSKCLDTKSSHITSKRCKLNDWVEANPLFGLKGKSEKQVFSKLLPEVLTRSINEHIVHGQKTDTTVTNAISNIALQKKRIDEMNAVVCDICSRRFASQHCFMEHQRLHCRERPYMNSNYKRNGAFRDHLRARESYPVCNKRTNRPLRQYWRAAPETNGRFRSKRNGRQSFYRRTGLRNNGNGAPSRLNENIPSRKSKRCKNCGKWFTNDFQFYRHFKKCCNSFQVIPKPPNFLYMNTPSI